MWGVCLDADLITDGLFQTVVQYEPTADSLRLLAPDAGRLLTLAKVRPLAAPPRFYWGQKVTPRAHPERISTIRTICWHFKRQAYFYRLQESSRRYFEDELDSPV